MWVLAVLLVASPAIAEPPPSKAPAEETDWNALIRRGGELEAKSDWEAARGLYEKLEASKAHRGQALYLQARVAFKLRDYARTQDLAKRAVAEAGGSWKLDAKILYGDAIFATGQYQRARDIFLATYKLTTTAAVKKVIVKKVIAANKALGLADRDGL
jgi:tetratricopeptide (TPR) repeat protein